MCTNQNDTFCTGKDQMRSADPWQLRIGPALRARGGDSAGTPVHDAVHQGTTKVTENSVQFMTIMLCDTLSTPRGCPSTVLPTAR